MIKKKISSVVEISQINDPKIRNFENKKYKFYIVKKARIYTDNNENVAVIKDNFLSNWTIDLPTKFGTSIDWLFLVYTFKKIKSVNSKKIKTIAMKKIFFKKELLNKYLIKNILIYQSQN